MIEMNVLCLLIDHNHICFRDMLNLKLVSKHVRDVTVQNLFEIPQELHELITRDVLLQFPNLKSLIVRNGSPLTDEDIMFMHLLHIRVEIYTNITDKSIKTLNIKHLATGSEKITNEGIEHLKLESLLLGVESPINDKGVSKQKSLKTLVLNKTDKGMILKYDGKSFRYDHHIKPMISNMSLSNLNLKTLVIPEHSLISNDGISHMDLETLCISAPFSRIDDDGIKNMNLRELYCIGNRQITSDVLESMKLQRLLASTSEVLAVNSSVFRVIPDCLIISLNPYNPVPYSNFDLRFIYHKTGNSECVSVLTGAKKKV